MSLIINDKKVAGLYKAYVIQNATNTASGIIRIATEEEVKAGLDSLTAVTPKQLATKQDVLIAGNGLEILEDGTINNTQTSAEWGNIIGNILDQEDLNAILLTKANEEETAYELIYENSILTLKNRKGDTLSEVSINELPDVDDITIVINEENKLQSIGEKTKSGTFKYTWIGTESEYTDAKDLGIIDEFTECIIIDSEAEKVVPIVQYEAPTKLSQLANDIEFVTNDELQIVKTSLENKIDLQTDGAEIVHKVGNETIDGFKNFKQKIVIENGLGKGRIAHKPVGTSLEDGYIEFGEDILLYGKQNINGELYDEKHNIFHDGNLVAGDNITITNEDGTYKVNSGGGLEFCDTDVVIRNNEKIFNQLKQMRHSTFDLSKFTVVGSPTITEDGVASGFSSGNNLLTPSFDFLNKKVIIESRFTTPSERPTVFTAVWGTVSQITGSGVIFLGISPSSNTQIRLTLEGGLFENKVYTDVGFNYELNTTYDVKTIINFTTGEIELYYKIANNTSYVLASVKTNPFATITKVTPLRIGAYYTGGLSWLGSIDLKQFSIAVDGKEVFNSNKSGLDVIKPDNYTVVGSPVISDDGVASGLDSSNYISLYTLDTSKPFKLELPLTITENIINSSVNPWIYNAEVSNLVFQYYTNSPRFVVYYRLNIDGVNTNRSLLIYYTPKDKDEIKFILDCIPHKSISFTLVVNNEIIGTKTEDLTYDFVQSLLPLHTNSSATYSEKFNVDLNSLKIYVDGNLVYQPCLKIPYNISKTGSKIVDVAYRDRVIDLYEQEGRAGYYTIDEINKNFTLPMGEIYGMIGQRNLISSTVTEINRVDIYSDKTCLICGNVATAGTINLPIELVNNNYFITLSTSAKTATSFTTTATGDYILIGKVL